MGFLSGKARGNEFSWCKRSRVFRFLGINITYYWFHEWSWNRYCWGIHAYTDAGLFRVVQKLVIDLGPFELAAWEEYEL